jgi:hypothetical protein
MVRVCLPSSLLPRRRLTRFLSPCSRRSAVVPSSTLNTLCSDSRPSSSRLQRQIMPYRFRPLSSSFSTSALQRLTTSLQHWRSVVRHNISKFRSATPSSNQGVSNRGSSQHIDKPRHSVRLGNIKSADIARLKNDIDIALESSVMKNIAAARPGIPRRGTTISRSKRRA